MDYLNIFLFDTIIFTADVAFVGQFQPIDKGLIRRYITGKTRRELRNVMILLVSVLPYIPAIFYYLSIRNGIEITLLSYAGIVLGILLKSKPLIGLSGVIAFLPVAIISYETLDSISLLSIIGFFLAVIIAYIGGHLCDKKLLNIIT